MAKTLLTEISIKWCAEDVLIKADQMNINLTPEEVSDVLSLMKYKHDASIGINWDVIGYYINQIVEESGA